MQQHQPYAHTYTHTHTRIRTPTHPHTHTHKRMVGAGSHMVQELNMFRMPSLLQIMPRQIQQAYTFFMGFSGSSELSWIALYTLDRMNRALQPLAVINRLSTAWVLSAVLVVPDVRPLLVRTLHAVSPLWV